MEAPINLIDHTMNSILTERQKEFPSYELFELLKKYSVTTIDLSVQSVKRILYPVKSHRIRMEIDFRQLCVRHLEKYYSLNFDAIIVRWTHGDETVSLQQILECVSLKPKPVFLKIINFSKLEQKHFNIYEVLVKRYGIEGIIISDEDSRLDPYMVIDYINQAKRSISCKLEFCAGNGCGLATANSLAVIRCGVCDIHTVVGGANLTEGAAMEEIILACRYFQMAEICNSTSDLAKDSRKILQNMRLRVPVDKAIIGNGIFSHESGIHVDGIMKNPRLYEVICPEDVGIERKIVIGKHSGKAAVKMRYGQMGIELSQEEISTLTNKIKQISLKQNSSLSYQQLIDLYRSHSNQKQGKEADLDESITTI
jgi:homocitrate synthase NifV